MLHHLNQPQSLIPWSILSLGRNMEPRFCLFGFSILILNRINEYGVSKNQNSNREFSEIKARVGLGIMSEYAKRPAKPFLKWAGGKTQIMDKIEENLPLKFNDYYEPFLGGGSVFFFIFNNRTKIEQIRKRGKRKFFLSDKNEEMIATYEVVRDEPSSLISELSSLQKKTNKEGYYEIRKQNPRKKVKRAARFIFLNKTCYNGLYRVNKEGKFNVPWNGVKDARIFDRRNIEEVNYALKTADLFAGDFEELFANVKAGDLIYADPPYHIQGFRQYTSDGFLDEEHHRLANLLTRLTKKGCFVLHSNSYTTFIEDLYPDPMFHRCIIQSRRMINRDGAGRKPIPELLIRNYPMEKSLGSRFEQKLLIEE